MGLRTTVSFVTVVFQFSGPCHGCSVEAGRLHQRSTLCVSGAKTKCRPVFIKLWSADHRCSAVAHQVVRDGPQGVSEEKALQKIVSDSERIKILPYMPVLELPLLVDFQQM
jgi:hypothetical protein